MQSMFIGVQRRFVITSADPLSFRWAASGSGVQWSYDVGEEARPIWLRCSGIFFHMAGRKGRVMLSSVAGYSALRASQAPVLSVLTLLVHPAE